MQVTARWIQRKFKMPALSAWHAACLLQFPASLNVNPIQAQRFQSAMQDCMLFACIKRAARNRTTRRCAARAAWDNGYRAHIHLPFLIDVP